MTEVTNKFKVPAFLKNQKFLSSLELGAWFAGVAISFFTLMSTYNFVVGKINDWLERRYYAKLNAQMRTEAMMAETEAVANV